MKFFSPSENFYRPIGQNFEKGLEVWAPSREALLEDVSLALMDTMFSLESVVPKRELEWSLEASSPEELVLRQLQMLLNYFNSQHMLFSAFQISFRGLDMIKCLALGEPFNASRHFLKTQVKDIQNQNLFIGEKEGYWSAHFNFVQN